MEHAKYPYFSCSIIFILCLTILYGCDSSSNLDTVNLDDRLSTAEVKLLEEMQGYKPNNNEFYFGFDLRASPKEDARQYLPFLQYLENSTGYRFKLRFTPKNSDIVDLLGTNKVQFAALGAVSYIKAHNKYDACILARGINSAGNANYRSMIVVKSDSNIKNIDQLKGKRFAFGSINSTQGHLIPRIELMQFGISLSDLGSYTYTGSHHNCAEAVISKKADACGMQDTLALTMKKNGLLRILYTSNFYPSSGIAANKHVPLAVLNKVQQALLDFEPSGKDKEGLYHWYKTEMPNGFVRADDHDYEKLSHWITKLSL